MMRFAFIYTILIYLTSHSLFAQEKTVTHSRIRFGAKDTAAKQILLDEHPGHGDYMLVNYLKGYDTAFANDPLKSPQMQPNYGFYIKTTNDRGKVIRKTIIDSIMDLGETTEEHFMTNEIALTHNHDIEYHQLRFLNKDTGFLFITHKYYSYGDLFQPRILRTVNGGQRSDFIPDSNEFLSWKGQNMANDFHIFNTKKGILFYRTNNEYTRHDHQLIEYITTKDGGTKWEYHSFSLNTEFENEWHYYNINEINYTVEGSILLTFTARKSEKDEKDRTFTIYSDNFGLSFVQQN